MMLKTPNTDEFLVLDKKRTGGGWRTIEDHSNYPDKFDPNFVPPSMGVQMNTKGGFLVKGCPDSDSNAKFIAQSTKIADEIRALKEENERLRASLEGFPSQKVCNAARRFLSGAEMGINHYEDRIQHLKKCGEDIPEWMKDRKGHITKWDQAECVFKLMATGLLKEIDGVCDDK